MHDCESVRCGCDSSSISANDEDSLLHSMVYFDIDSVTRPVESALFLKIKHTTVLNDVI